ncbi:MAG: hypothetical protein K2I68_03575 [Bacteroidales bacterium]|nr:hypothetical protein [Bacteroidales bacterium]
MKNMIISGLLFCLLAGFGGLNAQETTISKTPAPSEPVMKEFAKNYADAENPVWYTYQDANGNPIYCAAFMRGGDEKCVYYRNDRYANLITVVPVEYCPRKIKNLMASLHADFQISEVVYMQSIYGSFYRVTLTKGKKKKMERLMMFFSPAGELPSDANDATFEMLRDISVVPTK